MTETLDFGARAAFTEKTDTFVIPVGDVIMAGVFTDGEVYVPQGGESCAVSQIWWISNDKVNDLLAVAEVWEQHGLKLCFGVKGEGTDECPAVIENEEQQRGPNMAYAASTRGVGAYIGDRWAWFEIEDTELLYDYMVKHSDIPAVVKCDVERYSNDERYRQVFDIANEYFQYYYINKKPKNLRKTAKSEKQRLEDLYDV